MIDGGVYGEFYGSGREVSRREEQLWQLASALETAAVEAAEPELAALAWEEKRRTDREIERSQAEGRSDA